MGKKWVEKTYGDKLCCSCGLCEAICDQNAISFKIDRLGFLKPIINKSCCINCGLCYKYCPGINDFKNYVSESENYLFGYSMDDDIRRNSSSGGIATEFLSYIIDRGIVDYVSVVSTFKGSSKPKQILTNDISIIKSCKTSKYCPVSFKGLLNQIKSINGTVAIIALPCQINSLKTLVNNNKILKQKIKYFISLLCNHVPSYNATKYLHYNLGIKKLERVCFRGNGWPGYMSFFSKSGSYALPFRKAWASGFGLWFKNIRCDLCNDPFSKNADIVFGDAYFLEEKDVLGSTFCIVRNHEIMTILNEMSYQKLIKFEKGPDNATIHRIYSTLFNRESEYLTKIACLKSTYANIPHVRYDYLPSVALKKALRYRIKLYLQQLGRYRFLWKILFKIKSGNKIVIRL